MKKSMEVKTERSPEVYIRTVKAAVLAVIRLAEALAGCFGLWYLITYMNTVPTILEKLLEIQTDGGSKYAVVYQAVFSGLQIGMIIQAALLIPDGLAGFFTRFTRKGARVEVFFRFLSFATGITAFFLGIAGMGLYCNSVIEAAQNFRRITIGELITIFGIERVIAFLAVYCIIFLILVIYHFCAGIVMQHVQKELKTGNIRKKVKKSRLGNVAAACSIIFVISAILSVAILTGNEKQFVDYAGFLKPILSAYKLSGVYGIGVALLLALKFFLVNRCCADFNKAHGNTANLID